tara:strand:- start:103 stop:1194 length:1092 start_codon:yes stop_codon:yes gene_type:complete
MSGWLKGQFRTQLEQFCLDVELRLPAQGVTALFGRSGSGKTTLLRCLAGLQRADSGRLIVGGQIWQNSCRFVPPHRRPIGYVFQEASLLPHLSVKQNLCFGLVRAVKPARIDYQQVVELLAIGPLLERMPDKLSGGERQRVAIGRALLSQPQLLLMDEPLSALDTEGKQQILPYLQRLARTLAIPTVYVSHSLDEVCRLADRVLYLEEGRVADQGPLTEVVARLPLGRQLGQESAVVEARLLAHDAGHGLSYLDLQGQRLSINLRSAALGEVIRVRIPARDVAISLTRIQGSSMLNTLPARVTDFEPFTDGVRMLIRLHCGDAQLLSKITRKSFQLLGIRRGLEVYAQIKTVSLFDDAENSHD